jgi:phytoene dehydrogenase-like protein
MSTRHGKYDCIVVGGGHNGLVCAAYLARSGRSVLVLEAAGEVGGAAITREFASGFRVSAGAHLLHLMPPALVRELALERHGLKLAASNLATIALADDGAHLVLDGVQLASTAGQPAADAAAYSAWRERMQRLAAALHPVLAAAPPRLGTGAWRDRAALLALGWRIRRLGRTDMRELLRIGGMCVYDLLQDEFRSPLLQGALATDALLGTNYGPRSPGTVFTLLYRLAASGTRECLAQPQGGLGALSQALAGAATAAGAQIRTGQAVARILVQEDRVRGVLLESGEELSADTVISSADPKTTFLRLLGSEHLDAGFTRRVTQLRSRGVAAKLHLALEGLPAFAGLSERQLGGRLLLAPSLDYLERAYNHSKYREFSSAPMLEITVPTLADPTLAAPGTHVMSVIAQYAPFALEGGWSPAARQSFTDLVIDSIARYAPQLRGAVRAAELLTPPDIEREFRIAGGHWHHAELALDQFFMVRPLPGTAQYRAPVAGLYLCGAACHPGGGVMGLAGRNAARQLLSEAA